MKLDVGKWFCALASATDLAEAALGGWRAGFTARDRKHCFICANCISVAAMTKRDAHARCLRDAVRLVFVSTIDVRLASPHDGPTVPRLPDTGQVGDTNRVSPVAS